MILNRSQLSQWTHAILLRVTATDNAALSTVRPYALILSASSTRTVPGTKLATHSAAEIHARMLAAWMPSVMPSTTMLSALVLQVTKVLREWNADWDLLYMIVSVDSTEIKAVLSKIIFNNFTFYYSTETRVHRQFGMHQWQGLHQSKMSRPMQRKPERMRKERRMSSSAAQTHVFVQRWIYRQRTEPVLRE